MILKHTDAESVKRVMMVLLTLQAQEEWEVRHGGLMGLKYLMAVRQVGTVLQLNHNNSKSQWKHRTLQLTSQLSAMELLYINPLGLS